MSPRQIRNRIAITSSAGLHNFRMFPVGYKLAPLNFKMAADIAIEPDMQVINHFQQAWALCRDIDRIVKGPVQVAGIMFAGGIGRTFDKGVIGVLHPGKVHA